ncbi:MAG: hypothetical protein JOZ60_03710, partial [Verrucomicrobia bacterium]|nr:hypothetical protein [Verrucomicrobiota bacterium]
MRSSHQKASRSRLHRLWSFLAGLNLAEGFVGKAELALVVTKMTILAILMVAGLLAVRPDAAAQYPHP